jgi:hypothetical protein
MSLRGWCPIGVGSLVVALAVSGCGGQGAECSCSTAEAKVEQPALSSPVASVNADGPCMASTQAGADGGVDVHVEVIENITTDTGSCQVHEMLADGTVLVAVFEFARNGSGCCASSTHAVAPAPMFTPGND